MLPALTWTSMEEVASRSSSTSIVASYAEAGKAGTVPE